MQLVKLNETTMNGTSVQTVNARELHTFLEVGKDFSNWIKDRIAQYGFAEGADYVIEAARQNERAIRGGQNIKEYHISLDMAKELSMVERNEKGKQATLKTQQRQSPVQTERKRFPLKFGSHPKV